MSRSRAAGSQVPHSGVSRKKLASGKRTKGWKLSNLVLVLRFRKRQNYIKVRDEYEFDEEL